MSNAFLGDSNEPEPDYNERIIKLIQARMKIGKERYGHGLRFKNEKQTASKWFIGGMLTNPLNGWDS